MATTSMEEEGSSENIQTPKEVEKCAQLRSILERDVQVIPEDALRKITQGVMKRFMLESKEYFSIAHLWDALLRTFQATNVSSSHRIAICNGVTGFLEAAWGSQDQNVRQFAQSEDVWFSILRVYWTRFEEGKSKPMSQVLATLTKILRNHPARDDISQRVVSEVTSNLVLAENRSKTRAFLISLEFFLRKEAISMTSLLSAVETWLVKNYEKWVSIFKLDCSQLSIPTDKLLDSNAKGDSPHSNIPGLTAQVFALILLRHAVNPDSTASAGLLLSTMQRRLKKIRDTESSSSICHWDMQAFWVLPLKYILLQNLGALETMSNYILYPLFSADHAAFHSFIKTLPIQAFVTSGVITDVSPEELTILFSTLQVAKELGLVHEDHPGCKENPTSKERVILDSRRVGKFVGHQENSIRISALALLITAPSTTKPLSLGALEALRNNMPYIHSDPDSHTRGEVLNMIRKLIIRLRGGMSVAQKMGTRPHPSDESSSSIKDISASSEVDIIPSATVEDQLTFLQWYVGFLQHELRPSASYQSHISALRVLELLLRSGADKRIAKANLSKLGQGQMSWVRNLDIFRSTLFKALVDLLIDPFDDVRAASLAILNLFPVNFISSTPITVGSTVASSFSNQLFQATCRAEDLASLTSRADHADTVARLFYLLFVLAQDGKATHSTPWYQSKFGIVETILSKLEQKLACSTGLIYSRMKDQPLHGYISALRYIVGIPNFYSLISEPEDATYEKWNLFHNQILSLCERIWVEIKDVLCVDSPEGHTENTSEDSIVGPKDILSYSWRALRESSLLLHSILLNGTYAPQRGSERLTRADFDRIGMLSFTQLAELRHRGAFSAVAQTFTTCCQCCGRSKEPSISSLPAAWYLYALKIIDNQAFQLTRRSAGLPALVSAIASSDPGGQLFQQVMQQLLEVSKQPALPDKGQNMTKLPQVHAMNCLKDIFTSTKLKQCTEAFVMPALVMSAECLDSAIWAIRNCGLMLFRGLMQRMSRATKGSQGFGDRLNTEAGLRIHFRKYPGLTSVLQQLLQPDTSTVDGLRNKSPRTEQVFPALELISEKVPSVEDDRTLSELVLRQTQNSVWAIREQAARTFAFLLNRQEEILPTVRRLADIRSLDQDQNHLHGRLLCIRYSLRRFRAFAQRSIPDYFESTAVMCKETFNCIFRDTRSPLVRAGLIDILNDVIEDGIASGDDAHVMSFIDEMAWDYGLHDVFEKTVFSTDTRNDAAHSSTLLRRALGLTIQVSLFLDCSESRALFSLIDHVISLDHDAAQWILEECHRRLGHKRRFWSQMITFYVHILTKTYTEKVMAVATSNLADILESFLVDGPSAASEMNASTIFNELALLPSQVSRMSTWGRDMVDSDLRLHGCTLAFQLICPDRRTSALQSSHLWTMWCHKLRFAIEDETEFTTRYSAVASMLSVIQASHTHPPPADARPFPLDIYLVLYDMLNDDDEELRDISAVAASYVLANRQESAEEATFALVPLATSSRLAQSLATNYHTSSSLLRETIQRLTGQQIKMSDCTMASVSALLDESMENSTVLFEEEKQNLFIDDAREACVWYSVLKQLKPEPSEINSTLTREFQQWVSEGLLSLTKAVQLEGAGGLLGFTSKTEIFILGLRVVYAARALLSRDSFAALDIDRPLIGVRAAQLLEAGRAAWIHEEWLTCLQECLSC